LVYNNAIDLHTTCCGGVTLYSTKNAVVFNNTITGFGVDGIGDWGGSYDAVLGNNVSGFTGYAQIVLDGSWIGLPDTTHSTVLCKTKSDTVIDLGTDNTLIGCQKLDGPSTPSKINTLPPKLRSHRLLGTKPLEH